MTAEPAPAAAQARRKAAFKRTSTRIAAAALATVAVGAWIASEPYRLIQLDFARQRVAAGLSQAELTVGDHRWAYVHADAGAKDAPLLVMVHGFTGSKENWYPLVHALEGAYALVAPDLAGWGDSQRIDTADYGFVAQAARLAEFIKALPERKDRPVVLVGHSMGGGIAALVAAARPDLVARVALIDAAGVHFADNDFGRAVLAGDNPFAVHDPASLERYLDTVFHDRRAAPWIPWPANRIYIERRVRDAGFEQGVLDGIGRGAQRFLPGDAAAGIAQPALLLWCRQDRVIDPSAMGLYAERMPHALQVLLDDCGHMAMMEQPDAVAAALDTLIVRGKPR